MIKTLTSSSAHVTVSASYPPTIYNNGQVGVGNVRYNPMNQSMEVFDGNMWQIMTQGATVGLSWEADSAIRWAIEKEKEEATLKERMERHPGLKDAYEKFQIMDILTKEEEKNEQPT